MICLDVVEHTEARAVAEPPRPLMRYRNSQLQNYPLAIPPHRFHHPTFIFAAAMAAARCAMRGPTLTRAVTASLADLCCRSTLRLSIRHFSSGPGNASDAPSFEIRKHPGNQGWSQHRLPDGSRDMTGPPGSVKRAEIIQTILTKKHEHMPFKPCRWIGDSVPELCRDAVPADFRADPLSFFESGRDDLEIAGHCLDYYIVQQHEDLSPRSQMHNRFLQDHAGQRALLWYIKDDIFDRNDVMLQPRFLRGIVHCLVAEGASERVADFIRLAPSPSALSSISGRADQTWKMYMLRSLLESAGYWADDDLNWSLRLCLSLCGTKTYQSVTYLAVEWMCLMLRSTSTKAVIPELYNQFIGIIQGHSDSTRTQWLLAGVTLNHPTCPSANHLTKFLDVAVDIAPLDPFIANLLRPRTAGEASRLYGIVCDAARLLYRERRIESAKALLEQAFDKFPLVFRRRHNLNKRRKDTWEAGGKKFKYPERRSSLARARVDLKSTQLLTQGKAV